MDSPPPPAAIHLIEKEMQRRAGIWMVATFISILALGFAFDQLGWQNLASLIFLIQFVALIWQTLSFIVAAFMFIACSRRG